MPALWRNPWNLINQISFFPQNLFRHLIIGYSLPIMKNELAVSSAILYRACLYYASILRSKALDTLGIQTDGCGFVCNKGLINIRNLVTQWWLFLFVCQYSTLQYVIYIKIHLIYIICIIFQYLVCVLRWYQSGRLHN